MTSGTLRRYIEDVSVIGLTSNPSIFDLAIRNSTFYGDAILQRTDEGKSGEALFFEISFTRSMMIRSKTTAEAVREPQGLGLKLVMLTGDHRLTAAAVPRKLNLDAVEAEMDLPVKLLTMPRPSAKPKLVSQWEPEPKLPLKAQE
jgi:hypothetical protein